MLVLGSLEFISREDGTVQVVLQGMMHGNAAPISRKDIVELRAWLKWHNNKHVDYVSQKMADNFQNNAVGVHPLYNKQPLQSASQYDDDTGD